MKIQTTQRYENTQEGVTQSNVPAVCDGSQARQRRAQHIQSCYVQCGHTYINLSK
jgi:hypothetical protein